MINQIVLEIEFNVGEYSNEELQRIIDACQSELTDRENGDEFELTDVDLDILENM